MKGRIIALDYGSRRIGVAISDPEQTVAFPRDVWVGESDEGILKKLRTLIDAEEAVQIIVGWPLSLQGEITKQTQETAEFIDKIAVLGVPIEKMDERWTTIQAERSGGADDVAAQILLDTYLTRG